MQFYRIFVCTVCLLMIFFLVGQSWTDYLNISLNFEREDKNRHHFYLAQLYQSWIIIIVLYLLVSNIYLLQILYEQFYVFIRCKMP